MIDKDAIQYRWEMVGCRLDERGRRLFAAAEVRTAGWGGLAVVAGITGLARSTINRGEDDLDTEPLAKGQVRRTGGGRKAVSEDDPEVVPELQRLVEPATLGDPMRPLIWVSKSMEKSAADDPSAGRTRTGHAAWWHSLRGRKRKDASNSKTKSRPAKSRHSIHNISMLAAVRR